MADQNFSQFKQSQDFDYKFLRNKTEQINHTIIDTAAATGSNYGVFFIAPASCIVKEVWETHSVAGTDGSPVTLNIEKLASGQALDAGTTVLSSALSLKTTANTPQQGTVSGTITAIQLARGDRLALKDAGALTNVTGVTVNVIIKYKN